MRERKRLETALATESDLARRATDIDAYFELAHEGEDVSADLRREIDELRKRVDNSRSRPCSLAQTTTATPS